jgi:hemoglobin
MTGGATLFDELGGEAALRHVVDVFVDRIFDDAMIGFMFRNASRERVKEKEYEFAANHLGAPVAYTGRPLREAHAPHAIQGGQFNRRLVILKETLEELGVPPRVREHWLHHTEALRMTVTEGRGNACDPTLSRGPAS